MVHQSIYLQVTLPTKYLSSRPGFYFANIYHTVRIIVYSAGRIMETVASIRSTPFLSREKIQHSLLPSSGVDKNVVAGPRRKRHHPQTFFAEAFDGLLRITIDRARLYIVTFYAKVYAAVSPACDFAKHIGYTMQGGHHVTVSVIVAINNDETRRQKQEGPHSWDTTKFATKSPSQFGRQGFPWLNTQGLKEQNLFQGLTLTS